MPNISAIYKRLQFNLIQTYLSQRYLNITDYLGEQKLIPGYITINCNITKNFILRRFNTQLSLILNNITNTRFQSVYGYPEPGRTIEIQLTIRK